MNVRNLRVFVYVIEEGTLARAAERLSLSQPAASRLLRLLEDELGAALFHRYKKRLIPTDEGDRLYAEASRILASIDGIPQFLAAGRAGSAPPLRVVCHPRLTEGIVLPALAALATRRPEVRVHLEVHPRRDLGRYVVQELFDLGIASLPLPGVPLEPEELCATTLKVLLRTDHALAGRESLALAELADHPYIALTEHTLLRQLADTALLRAGERLAVRHEVSISAAAHRLVAEGLGFTVTDAVSVGGNIAPTLELIPLVPPTTIRYGLFRARRPAQHPAADEFVGCVREIARTVLGPDGVFEKVERA